MAHIAALVARLHSAKVNPALGFKYKGSANNELSSQTEHQKYEHPKDMITLNIGGTKFQTSVDTLRAVPNTRLFYLAEYYDGQVKQDGFGERREFVFDHTPFIFQYILDFYRTGELHLPPETCGLAITDELKFWGLKESCVSDCCWQPYMVAQDRIQTYKRLHREFDEQQGVTRKHEEIGTKEESTARLKCWTFLADTSSSNGAKVYGIFTSLLILVNICTYMMGTLSGLRIKAPYFGSLDNAINASDESTVLDTSIAATYLSQESGRNPKLLLLLTTQPHLILFYFDVFCFIFFAIEYIVMMSLSPERLKFARSFLAVCDILYLVPLGLMLIIYYLDHGFKDNPDTVIGIIILQGLFAFRVLRIVRVVRHYRGFVVLALSLRASAKELLLLGLLLFVVLLFFANAIFFAELLQYDTFETVFQGFWWSLITITTIGYGDMYPKSISGCLVGSACAVAGLILMSIPIPIIANNFNTYYAFKNKSRKGKFVWEGSLKSKKDKSEEKSPGAYMPVTVI